MYCKQCGKEVMENSGVCPNCGAMVQGNKSESKGINWFILVGAVVSMIGTFLPAITFMGSSISFMSEATQTEGMGIITLAIIAGVLGFFPRARKFSFIPAIMAMGIAYVDISESLNYGAQMGSGTMLIMLGGVVIIIGSVIEFVNKKNNSLQ